MGFKRIMRTRPPFDKRSDDPNKNYGVGGLRLWFILKGKQGAVQIMLGTKLYPAKVMREWKRKGDDYPFHNDEESITCWDVGFHSKKKPHYFETSDKQECDILGKCYYDGSSLRGEDDNVVENYMEHGDDWIWEYLEKYYYEVFPDELSSKQEKTTGEQDG